MPDDERVHSNGDINLAVETIREDTNAVVHETKNLMVEARFGLTMLIFCILLISLASILLSTWLAKTITNSSTSFGSIVNHYFGFDRNNTEQSLTWWTPIHVKPNELISQNSSININHTIIKSNLLEIPYNDYPNFHTIVLPVLLICSILLGILAYIARVKCTNRDFAWGAIPKIPLEHADAKIAIEMIIKTKKAEPGIDYTIIQGTKEEPVIFALAETLEPLRKEGDIVDEGSQYEPEDVLK